MAEHLVPELWLLSFQGMAAGPCVRQSPTPLIAKKKAAVSI